MVYLRKLMSEVFFLKYFIIDYVQWKILQWKMSPYKKILWFRVCDKLHINLLACVPARAHEIPCISGNSMGKSRRFFKTAVEDLSLEETELFRSSAEITSFNEVAHVCPHQKSCFLQVFFIETVFI